MHGSTMDRLYERMLMNYIPYISKKMVNDDLSDCVLSQLGDDFYCKVYSVVKDTVHHLHILKHDAAVKTILPTFVLRSLDLDIYVDDNNTNDTVYDNTFIHDHSHEKIHQLSQALKLDELKKKLLEIVNSRMVDIDNVLARTRLPLYLTNMSPTVVISKSYVPEAIEVTPKYVQFSVNHKSPVKITTSFVNHGGYLLVRFSVNVHMTSTSPKRSPIFLHTNMSDTVSKLNYFPFDLYFSNLNIKCDSTNRSTSYKMCPVLESVALVESIDYTIADQFDKLLFSMFFRNDGYIESQIELIKSLLLSPDGTAATATCCSKEKRALFNSLLKSNNLVINLRDYKHYMYRLGPKLGTLLLYRLYVTNRVQHGHIGDITYQVNFPRNDVHFYHDCLNNYLCIAKKLLRY